MMRIRRGTRGPNARSADGVRSSRHIGNATIRTTLGAAAFLAVLALDGCASRPSTCAAGEAPAVADTLYFGTITPDGSVAPDAWARFVETIVTPRFPQGLTTFDASGQWRTADGAIVREGTHVLVLVHPATIADERSVAEIVAAYKRRFQQEAVLRVRAVVCIAF